MKKAVSSHIWKSLQILGEKQGAIKLADLAEEMNLGQQETLGFLRQIFPAGSGLEIYHHNNECWLDVNCEAVHYMLPLTPGEWISLHEILSGTKQADSPVLYSLRKKISENGPVKTVMELLNQLEVWDQELTESQQEMIKDLETSIYENYLLSVSTIENKEYLISPCKVLHLEGQLSLIAEDAQDHCLIVIPLKEIKLMDYIQKNFQPNVTAFQIEEFIMAVRAMNEKETRLILKIHDPQSINLFPDHHFLGKPCMITNPNGDLIWAAYVEPCESLFEWLLSLGKNVEILDPLRFKAEYLMYCEEKFQKIA
jgi:hypothetical protein